MSNLIKMPGAPTPPASPIPSQQDIKKVLNLALANIIAVTAQMGLGAYDMRSIGQILTALKFNRSQTAADVESIIDKVATEEHEAIKLHMLRASIDATSTVPTLG